MKADQFATYFKPKEAGDNLPFLKALLLGKTIKGVNQRGKQLELHFDKLIVTVDLTHFSFTETYH